MMASANRVQPMTNYNGNSLVRPNVSKPRYRLSVDIENIENDNVPEMISMHVDWGDQSKTPLHNIPNGILRKVCKRLYIDSSHLRGKVSHGSTVKGYTEIKINGALIRSHLYYANKGSWFDWAYFDLEEFDTPIVAKIMMIIDLSNYDIVHDMDQDPDTITDDAADRIITHFTKEM